MIVAIMVIPIVLLLAPRLVLVLNEAWGHVLLRPESLRIFQVILQIYSVLLFVSFGAAILYLGVKIIKQERYPPIGVRLLKSSDIYEGAEARKLGKLFIAFACVLLITGIAIGGY